MRILTANPTLARTALMLALVSPLASTPALASSEDAWQEFRANVETACTEQIKALASSDGETVIEVNPFGSESYGVALIVQTLPDESADRYVCVYDKQTQKAEISAPFTPPQPVSQLNSDAAGNIEPAPGDKTDAHLVGE